MTNTYQINKIIDLIKTLRGDKGCPWDQKQTPRSISLYLIEEVYELVDAIESNRCEEISEELGDVLFQIMFVMCLFEEQGMFSLKDVITKNIEKMTRRHPHVFSDTKVDGPEAVKEQWHRIKLQEKPKEDGDASILDTIPVHLPALMRAYRISDRASQTGFDWSHISEVIRKVEEELSELKAALAMDNGNVKKIDAMTLEIGDLLFTLVNLSRFAKIHPETALTAAVRKFEKRFRFMEQVILKRGDEMASVGQQEKDLIWEIAKKDGL